MQCNVFFFSRQTLCFKNNFGSFILSSKIKTNMKDAQETKKKLQKKYLYK